MRNMLITGAGSGLGEGTSLGLAQKGHKVIAAVQTWQQVTALREKARSILKRYRSKSSIYSTPTMSHIRWQ